MESKDVSWTLTLESADEAGARCKKRCICSFVGPVALPQLVPLALEILEGLAQLHEADTLHLDLKPANVLLDSHGHAYLSDFGISRATSTLQASTARSGISGTPHYL